MLETDRFPTVLLRHDLPDGTHHYDWMLATDEAGPLLTFRLDRDISQDNEPFEGLRLPHHRRHYLTYEGPISGNRGSVRRVHSGWCRVLEANESDLQVRLQLGIRDHVLRGIHEGSDRFVFGE
ncbi:MAG: hypothetical protein RIE32_02215 [Phycisphaerales bacterium]